MIDNAKFKVTDQFDAEIIEIVNEEGDVHTDDDTFFKGDVIECEVLDEKPEHYFVQFGDGCVSYLSRRFLERV